VVVTAVVVRAAVVTAAVVARFDDERVGGHRYDDQHDDVGKRGRCELSACSPGRG
jgi:hypothetical protein